MDLNPDIRCRSAAENKLLVLYKSKTMKMRRFKFLLLAVIAISLTAVSCNSDNDHDYHLEYIKVTKADVPDEFIFGQTYRLNVMVELPNSCYYFYGQYDYFYEGTSRLIYPIAHVHDNEACTLNIREAVFTIPVQALQEEPYVFNFYQGEDDNGQDIFLTIEVPVVHGAVQTE